MCNVVIPTSNIVTPRSIQDLSSGYTADLENERFDYADIPSLEGDYPAVGSVSSGAEQGTALAYADPGPVPSGPGYEKLNAILKNTLSADWKERGNPGNPNILACYRVCGLGYERDSSEIAYAWCAAFVSWALSEAGIQSPKTMGSQVYRTYGEEVDWRTLEDIRKNDIVIFKSRTRSGGHVGFVVDIDYKAQKFLVLGGNQSDNVSIQKYGIESRSQYVVNVRRNWTVPPEFDKPLYGPGELDETAIASGSEGTTV
jgi:uncharacterized protein (TIGR02594 family)